MRRLIRHDAAARLMLILRHAAKQRLVPMLTSLLVESCAKFGFLEHYAFIRFSLLMFIARLFHCRCPRAMP